MNSVRMLPSDVICEGILPHLSIRELQALDTAFTNKLHRPQLREVWKSYRWLRMDYAVVLDDLKWFGGVGALVVGIRSWRKRQNEDIVSFALANFPMLKQLHDDFRDCSINDEMLIELAHGFPYLEVLRLSSFTYYDNGITVLAQHCHQLHTIAMNTDHITDASIQALCDHCPHLQHIDISCCGNLTDASLKTIANAHPNLQSINVLGCSFTDEGLIFFADKCRELRFANCSCDDITSRGLAALWAANPNLTDVELSGEAISDDDIDLLVQNCRELKNISLMWCYELSDVAVIAVAEHCPQLRSLNISECEHVSNLYLLAIGYHCHELRSIDISHIMSVSDYGISALAEGCPLLQEFCARGTDITDLAVCDLVACSELCKIDLNSCQSISSDAVAAIAENCPLLSVLDISFCDNLHSDCLYTIAQHCVNLTKLKIENHSIVFEDEALLTLIVSCKQLRDLRCGERYSTILHSAGVFVH